MQGIEIAAGNAIFSLFEVLDVYSSRSYKGTIETIAAPIFVKVF